MIFSSMWTNSNLLLNIETKEKEVQVGKKEQNVQRPRGKRKYKTSEKLTGVATVSPVQMGSLTRAQG